MKYNTAILVARRQLDTATAQCINGSKKTNACAQIHVYKACVAQYINTFSLAMTRQEDELVCSEMFRPVMRR